MCLCVDLHMLSGVDEKVGEDNASSGDKDGHETSDLWVGNSTRRCART